MTECKARKYEMVLIVDANAAKEKKDEILKQAVDVIKKHGGNVINSQVWLEKQKFTFQIKKVKEGTYFLVNFEGDGSGNAMIRSDLRLSEDVLRFEVVKVD